MSYLALIQARCGSSRLPNKVLKDIEGKELILRVVERVLKSKYIKHLAVVTSVGVENIPLVKVCADNGIRVFTGSENDVLDRFYQYAKLFDFEYIVRITADCPLYDWQLLDYAIEQMGRSYDYFGDIDEIMADGLDIEILSFKALKQAWEEAELKSEREHVTIYIKNHPEKFKIGKLVNPTSFETKDLRLTVDEIEDLELVRMIYKHFFDRGIMDFKLSDIVDFFNIYPDLRRYNKKYNRNEGLIKSIQED